MSNEITDASADSQVVADRVADRQIQYAVNAAPIKLLAGKSATNKLSPEDQPVHSWYRFVLSFPSHLVRHYLSKFEIDSTGMVLDPFCGTGTTLVECKKLGYPSVGLEAHPMAYFAAATKLDWEIDPKSLITTANEIADRTQRLFDGQTWLNANPSSVKRRELLGLPEPKSKLLIGGSIDAVPLHRTLTLLREIERVADPRLSGHLRLALAASLPTDIGNLHFGPEVGVRGSKADAPVLDAWMSRVIDMCGDLETVFDRRKTRARALHSDSRALIGKLPEKSISAVVTSPPYPNEKDYTRTTRLESVVLGLINDRHELRGIKKGMVRSNTRGIYVDDADDISIPDVPEIYEIARQIEDRRIELGKTSGFERQYARVTLQYFGGMARHLSELRPLLIPGARLAYVVGDQASYLRIMIRTGQLLAKMAEQLGYEIESIDLFRERHATATGDLLREEVVVLRWPGT